jgi:hypothetical protein
MARGANQTSAAVATPRRSTPTTEERFISPKNRIPTWHTLKGKRYFTITETPLYTDRPEKYLCRMAAPSQAYDGSKLHVGYGNTAAEAAFDALQASAGKGQVMKKLGIGQVSDLEQMLANGEVKETAIPRVQHYAAISHEDAKGQFLLRKAQKHETIAPGVSYEDEYGGVETDSIIKEESEMLSIGRTGFSVYDQKSEVSLESDTVLSYDDPAQITEQGYAYVVGYKSADQTDYSQTKAEAIFADEEKAVSFAADVAQMSNSAGPSWQRAEDGTYRVWRLPVNETLEEQQPKLAHALSDEANVVETARAVPSDEDASSAIPEISFTGSEAIVRPTYSLPDED